MSHSEAIQLFPHAGLEAGLPAILPSKPPLPRPATELQSAVDLKASAKSTPERTGEQTNGGHPSASRRRLPPEHAGSRLGREGATSGSHGRSQKASLQPSPASSRQSSCSPSGRVDWAEVPYEGTHIVEVHELKAAKATIELEAFVARLDIKPMPPVIRWVLPASLQLLQGDCVCP